MTYLRSLVASLAALSLLCGCLDQSHPPQHAAAHGGGAQTRLGQINSDLAATSDQAHAGAANSTPGAPGQVYASQNGQSAGPAAGASGGSGFQAARAQIGGPTGPSPSSTLLQRMQAMNEQMSQSAAGAAGQAAQGAPAVLTPRPKLAAAPKAPAPVVP